MKTRNIENNQENDYGPVLLIIGITVMMNILFSSLGLDLSNTAHHIASQIAMVF